MNPLIILNDVWDDPTKAAGWRAKLPDEVNSNDQDDSTVPRL